ncbi:MAG TPA: YceI family protein [Acidimicrobiales bacterium]|nr:YceI family protein [Acidimicrobiales bacterium]
MTAPSPTSRPRRLLLWAVGAVAAVALLVVGGTWIYINVIRDDAPDRLTFTDDEAPTTTAAGDAAPATTAPPTTAPPATAPSASGDPTGTWAPGPGSVAGYRVAEILFGQSVEAVGRTEELAGSVEIDGTTIAAAEIVVDLASVESDDGRRDNQFRGRIMDVATFPTATFRLTGPVDVGEVPSGDDEITVEAAGELTLRDVTRPVVATLQARLVDDTIEVLAEIPVVFSDHDIPAPSVPGIDVEDDGLIEVRLVLVR